MNDHADDFSGLFGGVDGGTPSPGTGPASDADTDGEDQGTNAGETGQGGAGAAAGEPASPGATVGAGASQPPGAPPGASNGHLKSQVDYEDFVVLGPSRSCLYLPSRTPWPNESVNEWLPRRPKRDARGNLVRRKGKVVMQPPVGWLLEHRRVAAMSWSPGDPEFIRDRLPVDAGWVHKEGAITCNTYRAPIIRPGNPAGAKRWVDHWHRIYPGEANHCIAYLAFVVQRPGEKVNHCAVLGGAPKIGKDSLLVPMLAAVGPGNYKDISLRDLVSKNNEFLRARFVLVSEARDHGENGHINRYALYDHMKQILATPPYMLRINEKYLREYYIVNCFGLAATTNHRDAFYMTPDDRRHHGAWSESQTEDFGDAYWSDWWHWYHHENGIDDVVAYLRNYDISGFDPKAPPPKGPGFWQMANANRGEEHGALLDAIEKVNADRAKAGKPIDIVTFADLAALTPGMSTFRDAKAQYRLAKQLEECGFVRVDNLHSKQGLWRIDGKRQNIYARATMSFADRADLARKRAAE
jgi:hypothetical protein